ncbi:MAG TPA: glycosyltransferase family 9 protein [Vicinamibacteria bacterium]
MNVSFQRNVDRFAGSILCRILSLLPGAGSEPPASMKPRRILVILLSEMGSLVLAQPMFQRLMDKYPEASLHVLCFRQNKEVLDVLGVIPEERILTVRNDSLGHMLNDSIDVVKRMRRIGIDTVLDCELFSRVGSIYAFLSGAGIHVGFHPHTQEGLFRGNFINRPVPYNPYQHISQQFLTLVEAIESKDVPTVKRPVDARPLTIPPMAVEQSEIDAMSERFRSDFPQAIGKKVVLLSPGGGLLPIRAWPATHFGQLAESLVGEGYLVAIIGLEKDKETAKAIVSHCDSAYCIDLTGYTKTVRELMLLFHFATLLIANDGGPGHFAAMTPIPTIVFFGPESPALYGSLGGRTLNLFRNLSCSPCLTAYNHRNSPCNGDNVCLKSIHPDEVLQKTHALLEHQREPSAR